MTQVSSSTCRTIRQRTWQRRVAGLSVAVLTLGLVIGAGTPTAHADDLIDRRDRVRRALVTSKKEVQKSRDQVQTAAQRLQASQVKLKKAQRQLQVVQGKLADAQEKDRMIGAQLAQEQAELKKAKAEVKKGLARVKAQEVLIGQAVREAYQKKSDLSGLTVVFDSKSTNDLSQRIQWTTTIFDTTGTEMDRLRELQIKLQAAKDAQAKVEAKVAASKRASEKNVLATRALERSASAQQQTVTSLVALNTKNKKAAEKDLDADEKSYRDLQATERSVEAQIKARIAAQKRAEARARARANKQNSSARSSSPRSSVSSRGFVYPVNASPGSPFGLRYHPILHYWRMHRGQDFGAACGAPIYASQSGRVASASWQGGFGKYVVIDHGKVGGKYVSTGYAHQSRMKVHAGQHVRRGQIIGYVGTTGLSTGCHLHFQVYVNGGVVNPMRYI